MRERKEYKDYDLLELTKEEAWILSINLYGQSDFVSRYLKLLDDPLAPKDKLLRAKQYAQHTVKQTWAYLMSIFPGLDDSMSIGIKEGKEFQPNSFFVITKETALKLLSKQDNSRRVFTPDWERFLEEYKASHGGLNEGI